MPDENTAGLRESLEPVYFGCWAFPGHDFYSPGGSRLGPYKEECRRLGFKGVDNGLNPSSVQGEAAIHHRNGWTALAWADRSVDHRGGSNSVVFLPGTLSFEEAVEAGRRAFPHVFNRQPVPLWDTAEGRPS